MTATVAVVGLGAMGKPIAVNLVKAGLSVEVWNRSRGKIDELTDHGATSGDLDTLSAPIILTVLPDIAELREVLAHGLLSSLHDNSILVIMGTTSPSAVITLSDELSPKNIHVVDAPVSGGDVGAQRGDLSIMVGASNASFDRLTPIFRHIGKTILHVGPVGSGQVLKACNQLMVGANLLALGEALTIARKSGISDENFYQIIANGLAGSKALEVKWEKLHSGDFTPGGKSQFQLRDLKIGEELARSLGLDLASLKTTIELYQRLIDSGHGGIDHSGVIKAVE